MKRFLPLCLLLLSFFVRIANAQPPDQINSGEQEQIFSRQAVKTFSGSYLLYLPDHYSDQPNQKWPVLLYLHSSDARSNDLQKLKQEGLPYIVRTGTKLPFIVVAPLCPPEEWWDSHWSLENVNVLLDEITEKYRVDSRRITLTGWSMGGAGVWKLASENPTRFAAVVPISGRTQLKYVAPLHNTPIWAFHGADDPVVPPAESQKLVDALQKSGGNARLTTFPNTGHEAWRQVYTDAKVFEWMLKQSLKETATR